MRAEIISIGSEILYGELSSSASYLAREISCIGIPVQRITASGDNINEIKDVLSGAACRSDIVFTVGGLGAAPDDMTRQAAADFLEKELKFSRKAMENVAGYFAARGRDVPPACEVQADVIEGAEILPNSSGSSPGQLIKKDEFILIMLPGTLKEIESILKDGVLERLKGAYESIILKKIRIRILDLCEAESAAAVSEVIQTERQLEEGVLDFAFEKTPEGSDLLITCRGMNELLVDELIHKTKTEIYEFLRENIYAEDSGTLESVLGRRLAKKRMTLAVAESCTGGLLSSRITDAPGSSLYFLQGAVVYSSHSKTKYLGVSGDTLKEYGPVSEKTALEMAARVREISGSSCSLSVTGYAGPDSSEGERAGTGYIGFSSGNEADVIKVSFSGTRKEVKEKFASAALGFLWKKVKEA